jgi:uncharacterized membrane protein
MEKPTKEQIEIWRKDPKNWRFGFNIYYNPDDKRIFPRKYYKEMGWTTNFANLKSIIALILLLSIPIVLIYTISFLKK